jgi:hypothetical protein
VQFNGANAPLGVNSEQKKKTYWPGEELDEQDSKGSKGKQAITDSASKKKVCRKIVV